MVPDFADAEIAQTKFEILAFGKVSSLNPLEGMSWVSNAKGGEGAERAKEASTC